MNKAIKWISIGLILVVILWIRQSTDLISINPDTEEPDTAPKAIRDPLVLTLNMTRDVDKVLNDLCLVSQLS